MRHRKKCISSKRELLRQKSFIRRIRKRKVYLKKKNTFKIKKSTVRIVLPINIGGKIVMLETLPQVFSINNLEECIRFINKVTKDVSSDKSIQRIFFDLSKITQIDYLGICFILSLSNKMVGSFVSTKGNYPNDDASRQFIMNSGFCELVSTNVRNISKNMSGNILYTIGGNSVYNKKIGVSIKETVFRLTGKREHYAPVYENMLEICANSVEHGNDLVRDKNWLVSISFTDNDALFILMDTGDGILRTLKRKTRELFEDLLSFKSSGEVLNGVFNKKYQSASGEINRHKGLPNVLESLRYGYIDDLVVMTNKVFYNFSDNTYTKLNNEFRGTAFMWKVTKTNIEKYNHEN